MSFAADKIQEKQQQPLARWWTVACTNPIVLHPARNGDAIACVVYDRGTDREPIAMSNADALTPCSDIEAARERLARRLCADLFAGVGEDRRPARHQSLLRAMVRRPDYKPPLKNGFDPEILTLSEYDLLNDYFYRL